MNIYEVIAIGLYLLIMLAIGVYSYRKSTSTSDEFLIGGRKLGPVVTALSAGASDMSGWLLMGLPGAMYFLGLSSAWIAIGVTIGAYLNYVLIAPRLRIYTEVSGNAITLPVFFENRFKDKLHLLKVSAAIIILIFFTLYTSAGMVAGGRLFESAFGMDYSVGLWITSLVVVIYTFMGGFLAVSLTDSVQGTIMFFSLIVVSIIAVTQLGGVSATITMIDSKGSNYLDLFRGTSYISIISLLAWGLGYCGQPHIIVRFMAIDSHKNIKTARRVGMSWMIISIIGALCIGLSGIAYLMEFDPDTMVIFDESREQAETIFIYFARVLFHPFIGGFILTAILAAVMSTISSQLLVTSSSITEDIYRSLINPKASAKQLLLNSRLAVLFIAIIAFLLAINPRDNILNLVGNAWAGFGAAFGPLILLALLNKKTSWQGAFAGMLVGGLTVLFWVYLDHPFKEWYELIPGFFLALLTNVLVSAFTYKPDPEIDAEYEEMERILKS